MLKNLLVTALVTGAVVVPGPSASADQPVYDCEVRSVQVEGERFEGVLAGYARHQDGRQVTIRCYLWTTQLIGTTPVGEGSGSAHTAGTVEFSADRSTWVWLIAEVTTSQGTQGTSEPYDPYAFRPLPTGFGCHLDAVHHEEWTGQSTEGLATGYVSHDGANVSIQCFVTVNGSEVSSTPTGFGESIASSAGRVTFAAGETDVVNFCAEATTTDGGSPEVRCYDIFARPLPHDIAEPLAELLEQPLLESAWQLTEPFVAGLACPVIATAGYVGVLDMQVHEGDVYLDGERVWDCWPYDDGDGRPWQPFRTVDWPLLLTAG